MAKHIHIYLIFRTGEICPLMLGFYKLVLRSIKEGKQLTSLYFKKADT